MQDMCGSVFSTFVSLGNKVTIDGGDIVATVISFCFHTRGTQVQVSWWNNGSLVEQWVEDWRIKIKESV